MAARRLVLFAVAAIAAATLAAPAGAESQAECGQRVIRDWYSGGRVDRVYPLACYRAAIRALPSDVLQYSDADRDIARALAFARRGLRDPGDGPAPKSTERAPKQSTSSPDATGTATTEQTATTERTAKKEPRRTEPPGPPGEGPVRLASGSEPALQGAELPYPVLVLGALATILLASGAVGWLAARRH